MELSNYLAKELPLPKNWQNNFRTEEERVVQVSKAIYLQFLIYSGGFLELPVVRDGQIVTGPLWKTCPPQTLKLSAHSSELLKILQKTFSSETPPHLPEPQSESGDIFFYHALYQKLRRDIKIRAWASALRRNSPLTRLLRSPAIPKGPLITFSDGQKAKPPLSLTEYQLFISHPASIYLSPHLADLWAQIPPFEPQIEYSPQMERINTRRANIIAYIQVAHQNGRLSLLTPVILFLHHLLRKKYDEKIKEILKIKQMKISLREEIFSAYLGLLKVEEALTQVYRQELGSSYQNWSHPEEGKVLLKLSFHFWDRGGLREKLLDVISNLEKNIG